jgi:aromatic-amino-acid transaminase
MKTQDQVTLPITSALPDSAAAFAELRPQSPDVLLSLIKQFNEDKRQRKIDLGVGVYRDAAGATPVFQAVKAAETRLLKTQTTKAYLGPEGDTGFLERIAPIAFGADVDGLVAVQTPGGTGALRLAAELANAGRTGARIWLGTPSWPIHAPIFVQAGLTVEPYGCFDAGAQTLLFEQMMSALRQAAAGDLVLLHGCCHNPTGADPTLAQWRELANLISERGLLPLMDLAYQGLGEGLEPDALGLRTILESTDNALVAYSCDKNFGLYRERTGALFVKARGHTALVGSNVLQLARCAWSMPPDHGAAVVRVILDDASLTALWRAELNAMRLRLSAVRQAIAKADPQLTALGSQRGLFALLPLSPRQVEVLRHDHGIYMAASGRINLAGLTPDSAPRFVHALQAVRESVAA